MIQPTFNVAHIRAMTPDIYSVVQRLADKWDARLNANKDGTRVDVFADIGSATMVSAVLMHRFKL